MTETDVPIVRKQRESIAALETTVEALASENASILKALYKIAAESWNKYGSWAESVARAELKKHGLKTPPERE
jgi:hypothetical protein